MELRIHFVSYLSVMSSKNVLSERIPFDSVYQLLCIHLKDFAWDFAAGIRPSDEGAIFAYCSQLGSVHLHMQIKDKKKKRHLRITITLSY